MNHAMFFLPKYFKLRVLAATLLLAASAGTALADVSANSLVAVIELRNKLKGAHAEDADTTYLTDAIRSAALEAREVPFLRPSLSLHLRRPTTIRQVWVKPFLAT